MPNAIGTEGRGQGIERLLGGGDIIPRNVLPLWGRGGKGFDVFFWDGRVEATADGVHSQFAGGEPSDDPLTVAVHLPPVEIGEMVLNSAGNEKLQGESVESATEVFTLLAERLSNDADIGPKLSGAMGVEREKIRFLHVAQALAAFIRDNFRLKATRFHQFVFSGGSLSNAEIAGGLLFYGKARCSTCHNGPYFTNMEFHAVPFPQVGFGKNGFGTDYGRYNVTLDVDDLYKFRTPPLYNVTKTAPYSHSGSVFTLEAAIRAHTDPLYEYVGSLANDAQRANFYEQLRRWATEPLFGIHLSDEEIANLVAFLSTLEFASDAAIKEGE